jgi:hypothetical protein
MAAVYTSQYAPISDGEAADGAPLSVRAARDLADSMNNAKRYAMVDKVLSHISPLGTASVDTYTDEWVTLVFAPRVVPRGFASLRFFLGHWRSSGEGQTIWRLYSMPSQYRGGVNFAAGMLPQGSRNASLITSSDTYAISTNTVTLSTSQAGDCWLMLTGQNNVSTSISKLYTLDAWPVM